MNPPLSRLAVAVLLGLAAAAPPALAADFPNGATTPDAAELQRRLAGNNFNVNGEWRVKDGKVCTRSQKQGANCFAARLGTDSLLLQRANGEIVRYEPR